MEYNIIKTESLEALVEQVESFTSLGWELKGDVVEYVDGYAQQIIKKIQYSTIRHHNLKR
jgi:hypothetical protein